MLDIVNVQVLGNEEGLAHSREKNDVRQPVLVFDVKPVELPKGIAAEPIRSLVRLQPLDDCLGAWVNPPEHAVEFFKVLVATRAEDGEAGVAFDALGNPSPLIGDSEFKGKVVERGSQIVDAVANDETKVGRRLVERFEPRELVAVINIEIRPSSVRAFLSPSSHFVLKALQVVERPAEPSFMVKRHGC